MTRIRDIVVCVVIVGLDIVAAILGILAGVSQNRVCSEPSQKAVSLGLGAVVILALTQLLDFLRRFCKPSQDEVQISFFSQIFSDVCHHIVIWTLYLSAFMFLGCGLWANRESGSACGFNHNLLTIGGILCFCRAFFSAIYYISIKAGKGEDD